MIKREYTPEEEQERIERRKAAVKRAKARYIRSEKGKATNRRYREKNKEKLNERRNIKHNEKRLEIDMLERFFIAYEDAHPEFFGLTTSAWYCEKKLYHFR